MRAIPREVGGTQREPSAASRAVLRALASGARTIGSAEVVARRLGLSSRFKLARALRRDGVPPLHTVTGWFTVLRWLDMCERANLSLCRVAFREKRDPAGCYRLVKRVTGLSWRDVRVRGPEWAFAQLIERLHVHSDVFTLSGNRTAIVLLST